MAMERTFLAEDRTLMAVLRTALAMISFGFTIYQFLGKLAHSLTNGVVTTGSARNFGETLVILGVVLLISGLYSHYRALHTLQARRGYLHDRGLLKTPPLYRPTATGLVSAALLILGLVAVAGMLLRAGPLQ
jgi:putative membrane protein